jgi:hypothetical protein
LTSYCGLTAFFGQNLRRFGQRRLILFFRIAAPHYRAGRESKQTFKNYLKNFLVLVTKQIAGFTNALRDKSRETTTYLT